MAGRGEDPSRKLGPVYVVGGLPYRKKRLAEEVIHSEPKRSHPAPHFPSSHRSKVPAYAPQPFLPAKDYSVVQPEHRLAVLLSEILEYVETQAVGIFGEVPRLMQAVGELLTSVETRCKEKMYALAQDQVRVQQDFERNQAQLNLSTEQEAEQWKRWQDLMECAPENAASTSQLAFFTDSLRRLEQRKPSEGPEMPRPRLVLDKFSLPMQDELMSADTLLRTQALERRRNAEELGLKAAACLAEAREQQRTAAYRVFAPLLPALESDSRRLIQALTHSSYAE